MNSRQYAQLSYAMALANQGFIGSNPFGQGLQQNAQGMIQQAALEEQKKKEKEARTKGIIKEFVQDAGKFAGTVLLGTPVGTVAGSMAGRAAGAALTGGDVGRETLMAGMQEGISQFGSKVTDKLVSATGWTGDKAEALRGFTQRQFSSLNSRIGEALEPEVKGISPSAVYGLGSEGVTALENAAMNRRMEERQIAGERTRKAERAEDIQFRREERAADAFNRRKEMTLQRIYDAQAQRSQQKFQSGEKLLDREAASKESEADRALRSQISKDQLALDQERNAIYRESLNRSSGGGGGGGGNFQPLEFDGQWFSFDRNTGKASPLFSGQGAENAPYTIVSAPVSTPSAKPISLEKSAPKAQPTLHEQLFKSAETEMMSLPVAARSDYVRRIAETDSLDPSVRGALVKSLLGIINKVPGTMGAMQ